MSVEEEVRVFIAKELADGGTARPVARHEDLIMSGRIDSLAVVRLTESLEKRYGIRVLDSDVVPDNFRTVEALARFVLSKQQGRPPGQRAF